MGYLGYVNQKMFYKIVFVLAHLAIEFSEQFVFYTDEMVNVSVKFDPNCFV